MRKISGNADTAWLLGTSWSAAANDAANSKFLNALQEFVSTAKTDLNAVPDLLGISPSMTDFHRKATLSLIHLAVLGDRCAVLHVHHHARRVEPFFCSTCALVALSAINSLVGGCAATLHALHLTDVPKFFDPPAPQSNSLDMDDVVGSRVYGLRFDGKVFV
jgi:hypothetical protein